MKYLILAMVMIFSGVDFAQASRGNSPLKKIFFIGTGGTIAGTQTDPNHPQYDPGTVTIQAILNSVPDIKLLADVEGEQLLDTLKMQQLIDSGVDAELARKRSYVNVCSCDIAEPHWQLLAKRIERALIADGFDAVVITHGTDTIEETAFALQFLVHSDKPVILVGAARPANHVQPDGPNNIRQAVRVAISDKASGKGVMIVMGGRIYPGFNTTEIAADLTTKPIRHRFQSPHFGLLGEVDSNWRVIWNEQNKLLNKKILSLKFDTQVGVPLPKAPILAQYAGSDSADLVPMYEQSNIRSFVVSGMGLSASPNALKAMIKSKFDSNDNSVFVVASRTKDAVATLESNYLKGALNSAMLSPYQAKIFLQLVLQGLENRHPELLDAVNRRATGSTLREKIKAIWAEYLYLGTGISVDGS